MSEAVSQPALKGKKISAVSTGFEGALIILEGKKSGKQIVMTSTKLENGSKELSPVASGSEFSGIYEGTRVKKGTDGYADKSYIKIRCDGGTLVQVAMGAGLKRDLEAAEAEGLLVGDAISITFNGTKKLQSGKTFHDFSVMI